MQSMASRFAARSAAAQCRGLRIDFLMSADARRVIQTSSP